MRPEQTGQTARVTEAAAPILTPDQRLRVFISSTLGELAPERDAVEAAVRTLRLTPVRFELGARAHGPADVYRSYLEQSDVFVGIYWESYGWVGPSTTISGIEDELERSRGRPQLIYVKEPAPERDADLERLLDRVRGDALVSYRKFGAPGELSELVLDDLAVLLTERFHGRAEARALPEGLVTFVFVDMEGSTRIAQELAGSYPEIVANFQSTLARIVEGCGGIVIDTEGDGAFCVFPVVDHATRAAVAFQHALDEAEWPDGAVVRARVGIHTGEAQRTANNYVGLEVHRAARIGAAANGGQILVSRSSAKLLGQHSFDGWQLADLGSFALKGLDRAEELLQLNVPGLPSEIQAPRARGMRSVHLPTHLTGLLGRETEIAAAAELMERHDIRLVTLTGPGGIGKTRLGVASAARAADAYPDGVYFVPLADTRSTEQVVSAIASALGSRSEGSRALMATIEDRLSSGRALLVLDNFEQVVEARTVVAQLLESCPGLDLFVTSRTPLRLRGETEFTVPPLPEPDAVRLFVERAAGTRPGWTPTDDDAAAVLEICRRLDGLPLAIELAAARLRVLDPRSLLERLIGKLDVVGGSVPDLPERQRTLTATIEWSYDLLDEEERTLLARLAVFSGGWTVEAGGGGLQRGRRSRRARRPGAPVRAQPPRPRVRRRRQPAHAHARDDPRVRVGAAGRARRGGAALRQARLVLRRPRRRASSAGRRRHCAGCDSAPGRRLGRPARLHGLAVPSEEYAQLVADSCPAPGATSGSATGFERRRGGWPRSTRRGSRSSRRCAVSCAGSGVRRTTSGDVRRRTSRRSTKPSSCSRAHGPLDREAWARTLRAGLLPYYDSDLEEPLEEMTRAVTLFRQEDESVRTGDQPRDDRDDQDARGESARGCRGARRGRRRRRAPRASELVAANRTLRALGHLSRNEIEEARGCLAASAEATIYLEGTAYRLEGFAAVLLATGDPIRAATALGAAEGLRERTGIHTWPIMRTSSSEIGWRHSTPPVPRSKLRGSPVAR